MRFEINFIWDCQDPSEIIVYKGATVLDNIKIWHDYIPLWLEKIESHFRKKPLPDAPTETHPRNIYINLWLGPHLSAKSRSKIQSWATLLPRLRLININPEWDITATYVAKPPFWNPGNASDIWRLLVLARDKNMGEEDIARIYMDTDIKPGHHSLLYLDDKVKFGCFSKPLIKIEENIRKSGMMFFESFSRVRLRSDPPRRDCRDRDLTGLLTGNNAALVVFDIEKFRRFLSNNLNFEDYCWITFPHDYFLDITSLAARIKYLYATIPRSKRTYSGELMFDCFSCWSPAKSTIYSSGPGRLVGLYKKLFKREYRDNVHFDKNGPKSARFSKLIASNAEKYFLDTKFISNCFANSWLDKKLNWGKGVLRAKKYTMISELAYDIADRLDFEIRHFREYNLPFALLLALSYRQLVNETNIVEFAISVFGLLIPRMGKYFYQPHFFSAPFREIVMVGFDWLKGIIPCLEANSLTEDLVVGMSFFDNSLPVTKNLITNISILERAAVSIREVECKIPFIPSESRCHMPSAEERFKSQLSAAPALTMYPPVSTRYPEVKRNGFRKLNTAQKSAWSFIKE